VDVQQWTCDQIVATQVSKDDPPKQLCPQCASGGGCCSKPIKHLTLVYAINLYGKYPDEKKPDMVYAAEVGADNFYSNNANVNEGVATYKLSDIAKYTPTASPLPAARRLQTTPTATNSPGPFGKVFAAENRLQNIKIVGPSPHNDALL